MLNPYMNEHEQVEKLKSWWSTYGASIIIGIVVGLGLMYGWQYWQGRKVHHSDQASVVYQELTQAIDAGDAEKIVVTSQRLMHEYQYTPYAWLAYLNAAKQDVVDKNYQQAVEHLQWVVTHATDPSFQSIAAIRAARVLLVEGQYKQALVLLNENVDQGFADLANEIKGDVLLAMEKPDEAKKAYQQALDSQKTQAHPFLYMKLNDIAVTTENKQ